LLQQLTNGVAIGAVYALVALGYALLFGTMRVVNLAYGEILMVGAFAGLSATTWLGASLPIALTAGVLAAIAVGVLINELAVRPLGDVSNTKSPAHLSALITTIGAALFIQNAVQKIYGAQDLAYPRLISTHYARLGPVSLSASQAMIVGVTIIVLIGLWVMVRFTRWGLAVRAVTENASVASCLGMPVRRLQLQVVIISSALAGIAGVLVAVLEHGVTPLMGVNFGLKGLAALIVGGIESLPGAVIAALLLGMAEVLSVAYWSDTYRDAIAYGALLLVVLMRPQGILGRSQSRY